MKKVWWKEVVVYQIYPRSFKDANNDGNGDIKGIISKLDYIEYLGCKAIWISPFFQSPMVDNGYDISDYRKINPMFGSMKDFDLLIKEANKRKIAIINDAVFSHTSNKHFWFLQSMKQKKNKYSDFYIWRNKPLHLNKLTSLFSDSPWTYNQEKKQFYFHVFAKEQPDLNWKNPKVRDEIAKIVNFWIKKGVRGFRFDVIDNWAKDVEMAITGGGKSLHQYIQELRKNSWNDLDLLTVAESWHANLKNALKYCGNNRKEVSMLFQFHHIIATKRISMFDKTTFSPKILKEVLYKWQNLFAHDGWNSNFFQNHDMSRVVSIWGDDKNYWYESATALATINHLLKGTPYIYQGEEIGMNNTHFELNEFRDVQTIEKYKEFVLNKKTISSKKFLEIQNLYGRDQARTLMQWDETINGGFSLHKSPWIKINPNYLQINVKKQINEKQSILHYYKKLINLRTNVYKNTIVYGDFYQLPDLNENLFYFQRIHKDCVLNILVNLSNKTINLKHKIKTKKIILTNYKNNKDYIKTLKPFEAIVFK